MTLLDQVGLEGKSDFYVDSLSKGMKQRLCLARALVHNPSILIMDEPTAGLDPRTRVEFKEILKDLKDQKKTVFISSHILIVSASIDNWVRPFFKVRCLDGVRVLGIKI